MDLLANLSPAQASKPSVFELVASEKLQAMLSPALRYVLANYAARYPRYLLRVLEYHDELFLGLMMIVQRHYLRVNKGSFAESFYGFKRAHTVKRNRSTDLDAVSLRQSVLTLTVLPYLKEKLDHLFSELQMEQGGGLFDDDDDDDDESVVLGNRDGDQVVEEEEEVDGSARTRHWERKQWFRKQLRRWYPTFNLAYTGSHVLYQILYMFDLTPYYSPVLHLLGIEIKRTTMVDMRMIERESQRPRKGALAQSMHVSLEFLKTVLPLSIFFYKFVDWFFSTDYAKQTATASVKLPPPPPRIPPHKDGIGLPPSRATCPMCRRPIANPTALSTGYVFCYVCIHGEVEAKGQCPVTLRHVGPNDLRRIFASD
ncbi:Pex12 amino terminal region-domain-containing protein [Blastocladiella britannica]|nr:Pex12 amino terminal region-domain-containing protein [Blastocladiella britannica]